MIQSILKDPKSKDSVLLKHNNSTVSINNSTTKSIAQRITKEKERVFIKEYKATKSISKAKEASKKIEMEMLDGEEFLLSDDNLVSNINNDKCVSNKNDNESDIYKTTDPDAKMNELK